MSVNPQHDNGAHRSATPLDALAAEVEAERRAGAHTPFDAQDESSATGPLSTSDSVGTGGRAIATDDSGTLPPAVANR
ncbi:hypothetical protein ON058_10605 [Demequina sp. B12]|uniref:hypothetical protein n=1 Tax=Demequina sp. B12 TaxID=2992757 RepID=UPI00237A50DD|nr:hypothetical protein [Demequina sp. B12]MDE0573860.1 hypothetical protein [Demequina sp. B12]